MIYIGLQALRRLCQEQSPLVWQKAKLTPALFKPDELPVYEWVDQHVVTHHALPQLVTLEAMFPLLKQIVVPEPPSYYVKLLENKYFYERLAKATKDSTEILLKDKDAHEIAMGVMQEALNDIKYQKYRSRILDMGKEGPNLVLQAYHNTLLLEDVAEFGWPHMDLNGGVMPGDVVSFVGRPAMGKTWFMLNTALHNWKKKRNVLLVSMEMSPLPIAQRVSAMYAHTNISQLKTGQYGSMSLKDAEGKVIKENTYEKFVKGLMTLGKEEAKLYIVDGNLAASGEDVYALADQLKCKIVVIDGAYLLRHRNFKLDRFTRAAENVELMKRYSTDLDTVTFASWQFNRQASKKKGESGDLEDIGYSDAIGQISSIVLALFQEDGIETMKKRKIAVKKGRNGETGEFEVGWDFVNMIFDQIFASEKPEKLISV